MVVSLNYDRKRIAFKKKAFNFVRSASLIAANVPLPPNVVDLDSTDENLTGEKRRSHHAYRRNVQALSTVTNSVTIEDLDEIDDQIIAVVVAGLMPGLVRNVAVIGNEATATVIQNLNVNLTALNATLTAVIQSQYVNLTAAIQY